MTDSFWGPLIQQGGFALLAGLAIYLMFIMYQEAVKRGQERYSEEIQRSKEAIERERQDKAILVEVITRNTDSSTRLNEAILRVDRHIGSLTRRVDEVDKSTGG